MTPGPESLGRRLREPARLLGLGALLGVVMGVAWYLLAPRPRFEVVNGGLTYASELPGEYIAMDGWFAVLALGFGVISAGFVLWSHRGGRAGISSVLGLALGGVVGSLVAWGVGHLLAPRREDFEGSAVGTIVRGPLALEAKGVLVLWSAVALGIVLFALAWLGPKEEPVEADELRGGELAEGEPPAGGPAGVQGSAGVDRLPGDLDRG